MGIKRGDFHTNAASSCKKSVELKDVCTGIERLSWNVKHKKKEHKHVAKQLNIINME